MNKIFIAIGMLFSFQIIKSSQQLFEAVKNGNAYQVSFLLENVLVKKSINQPNNFGETALMIAADKGHAEIAALLVAAGADKNMRTHAYLQRTPYEIAKAYNPTDAYLHQIL
jgi:ankyrin repeat protein